MPGISLQLIGGHELAVQLGELGRKVSGPIARAAVKAGSQPILAAVIAATPVGGSKSYDPHPGLLKASERAVSRSDGNGRYSILIRAESRQFIFQHGRIAGRRASQMSADKLALIYDRFVEYGHRVGGTRGGKVQVMYKKTPVRITTRTGTTYSATRNRRSVISDTRGRVPAQPFMRPAFDANVEAAERIATATLIQGIAEAGG